MKKLITCICLTVFLSLSTFAQSNQDRARAYFMEAKSNFDKGDYQKTINYLDKVIEYLGASKPMTLSLRYKSYYNLKQYQEAQNSLNDFFEKSSNATQELKDEATSYIVKIDEALELENKKQNEALKLKRLNDSLKQQKIIQKEEREKKTLQNKETIIDFADIEKAPSFPGCTGNRSELNRCFNSKVAQHFVDNFNSDLPNTLGLPKGKARLLLRFTISANGNVKDVKADAPHPTLKTEVIRIIELLPRLNPGELNGVPVDVIYALPLAVLVEE